MLALPERLEGPRLETPRTRVPAGSVGIAGRLTGVYPADLPGGWNIIGRTARRFFDPERDPLGAGWNIIQSTTAIGSGGVFGKGLFEGTQSHLDFLPEGQTDFIIAVVAEELGLVGVITLLILYLVIIARGLYIATQARQTFGRLTAGGLTLTFFVYAFVNIAMVSGLLPVVGVPGFENCTGPRFTMPFRAAPTLETLLAGGTAEP